MPDDDAVEDYCDECGALITWGSVKTLVTSSDGSERVLCGPCAEAEHDRLWNGP